MNTLPFPDTMPPNHMFQHCRLNRSTTSCVPQNYLSTAMATTELTQQEAEEGLWLFGYGFGTTYACAR